MYDEDDLLGLMAEWWQSTREELPMPLHEFLGWAPEALTHWMATGRQPEEHHDLYCRICQMKLPLEKFPLHSRSVSFRESKCSNCLAHRAYVREKEAERKLGSCQRKVRYDTFEDAARGAMSHSKAFGPPSIYQCRFCGGYHLTSKASQ